MWAELDAWATSDATRALVIRPAKNFLEGRRYAVALRDLRDAAGNVIAAEREFEVLRDGIWTFIPEVNRRAWSMARTFADLEKAGVDRDDLYLAWDFTVASERNLSERVLKMRDDAFARIAGTGAPAFTVTAVQDDVSSTIWRRVRGTIAVPKYLTGTGAPGSRINYGPDGLPARNGTYAAEFVCNVPRSVYSGTGDTVTPGRALVYGHGLLGSKEEVNGFGDLGNDVPVRRLRGRLDRHVDRRRAERARDPAGPLEVPVAARPFAAVVRQLPVPRTRDEAPERLRVAPGVPCRCVVEAGHRDRTGVLQRQQPGRDHGRRRHRHLDRVDARRARRSRHELLDAADPQRALGHVLAAAVRLRTRTSSTARSVTR
ncbi:MAG: hypothetical protein KatS3mg010_1735 [Acidimicrobiia bacterium]|nr:MAG: hypothetical protein KatS3mg010_1735 [Acidimicrobiia bacterium]